MSKDRTGQQLADYQLLRLLGQGTFGAVYEGEHLYLKTHVAIKVLHAQMDQAEFQHFLAEARTIAALEHPHIVRVQNFSIQEQTPYLVMQLALSSLKERFAFGHPQPIEMILPFVQQAANGLQHAHSQQIMHLDIKPANLLLTTQQGVLLADFGLALALQTQRTHMTLTGFAGTPGYAAPEQFQNKPGWASDQYALGVMVYQWLTGTLPFAGDWMAIGHQKVTQDPPPLRAIVPSIEASVEQVVLRALATNPRQRFASVHDFAIALEHAVQQRSDTSMQGPSLFSAQPIDQSAAPSLQISMPPAQAAFPIPITPSPTTLPAAALAPSTPAQPTDTSRPAMGAGCEIELKSGYNCGIMAIGRCATCGRAFCRSHQAPGRYDLCALCTEAEKRKWDQKLEKSRQKLDKMLLEVFYAEEYFRSGAARTALLTSGVRPVDIHQDVWTSKSGLFRKQWVKTVISRPGWILGEFLWERMKLYDITGTGTKEEKRLTALLDDASPMEGMLAQVQSYSEGYEVVAVEGDGKIIKFINWLALVKAIKQLIGESN